MSSDSSNVERSAYGCLLPGLQWPIPIIDILFSLNEIGINSVCCLLRHIEDTQKETDSKCSKEWLDTELNSYREEVLPAGNTVLESLTVSTGMLLPSRKRNIRRHSSEFDLTNWHYTSSTDTSQWQLSSLFTSPWRQLIPQVAEAVAVLERGR